MKRACSIVGWTLVGLVLCYALNELLLDLLLSALGITKPPDGMLNAFPHAVGLVLRTLAILADLLVAIWVIVLGSKGKLPGTRVPKSKPARNLSDPYASNFR
jgi:hypothetical protein